MVKEARKNYEAPKFSVTELCAEDIIMASTLITLTQDNLLGKGKVNWIELN